MLRVRASGFLAGFAVASAVAMFQLQKEVWASHRTLSAQAQGYHSELESRILQLEKSSGVQLQSKESEQYNSTVLRAQSASSVPKLPRLSPKLHLEKKGFGVELCNKGEIEERLKIRRHHLMELNCEEL